MLNPQSLAALATAVLVCLLGACQPEAAPPAESAASPETLDALVLDKLVEDYLVLELAMGEIDAAHVDAYFGPARLREQAQATGWTLDEIASRAEALATSLETLRDAGNVLRIDALLGRLTALSMRVRVLKGDAPDFDSEAEALFGARAPDYDAAHFDAVLGEIEALVPGEGTLSDRVNTFRDQFMIPRDKLDAVFRAAMDACRERTLANIALPDNERFRIEYVSDKPWSGYNWYEGDAESLIQVNTDLPTPISRAVDLGCHEGYPGHHTFNALVERDLVEQRGWIEYSLYPLYSPQSLVAEGSGNYGIELAFPGDERVAFEREVLFPLAGLDASEADRYYELLDRLSALSFAGNEAARDYLNGDIDKQAAIDWLMRYSLSSRERAEQRVRFFDTYRSYVVNYNLGKALVAAWVERDDADAATRWARFSELLSTPVVPGALGRSLPDSAR